MRGSVKEEQLGTRPITDVWILARPKVKYYGAFPNGFLERARVLLGVAQTDYVLHVCSGRVKDYPGVRGKGKNDFTLDADPAVEPDHCVDLTDEDIPYAPGFAQWDAILCDPPYTPEDAAMYGGKGVGFPSPAELLRKCVQVLKPGGRAGMLHYIWARPPAALRSVAVVAVLMGFGNRVRVFSVYERTE